MGQGTQSLYAMMIFLSIITAFNTYEDLDKAEEAPGAVEDVVEGGAALKEALRDEFSEENRPRLSSRAFSFLCSN